MNTKKRAPRANPLRQLLDGVAGAGVAPTPAEIAALPLARYTHRDDVDQMREDVAEIGQEIARFKSSGHNNRARELAANCARRWSDVIGDEPPLGRPDTDNMDDPRELAALVADRNKLF